MCSAIQLGMSPQRCISSPAPMAGQNRLQLHTKSLHRVQAFSASVSIQETQPHTLI